jgi:type III pantothenate kinase
MTTYTLLFDVGNTNIKFCPATSEALGASFALPSAESECGDLIGLHLDVLLRRQQITPDRIEACIASSVVPALTLPLRHACRRFLDRDLLLAPEDLPIPLENRYASPSEVGADRLVGAFAARRLLPSAPSIISVDYGTATTFDCVSGNAYLGGLICPGVLSSATALASRTAKLPHIGLDVDDIRPEVGRSTVMSINHGFVFGFAAMTEGLCRRLAEPLAGPVSVIATGGFAGSLAKVVRCFDALRPDLLLEGLRLLYYESKE